jgi:L-malate glycosyltransferase
VLNGLDLEAWRPRWEPAAAASGAALRRRLGVDAAAPLLLNVGSLTPQKDQAGLLQAMAGLRRQVPQARLLILGEGFLRPQLEQQRRQLGLDEAVLMPGFEADIAAAMAAADLLVLSSYNEGMARVLIEAAASGLPAVATDVSGTRLAVREEISGRVVPPRNPQILAAVIAELLADDARRQAMGQAARRLAEQRFGAARMLAEVGAVIRGDAVEGSLGAVNG